MRNIALFLLGLCCHICFFTWAQRPKIGVTLSGGGAKGLAHIGILKAIDSAGLPVEVVSGTSMGAVIGALYAAGYSANSIEKIAENIRWDLLLSNASSVRSFIMDEKDEYGKYAIELPWVNNSFHLPTGLIESEELWLQLQEFFFPLYNIKDFKKFPKSFVCIATDISNGNAVVLDTGEIVQAVRASISIPSLFSSVDYQNKKLIDGGLIRNFPVRDAKNLGAGYIIGSNVSGGLLPKEKIKNALQILLQIAFFREDEDSKKEKTLCNLYISHSLDNYTMGSFDYAAEIIKEGNKKGNELYPVIKKIADSLNALYGKVNYTIEPLPKVDSVYITQYQIKGLLNTTTSFFVKRMQFENNKWYTAQQLSNHIRKAFGSRYYNKIIYSLQPLNDGSCKIVFEVEENPLTFAKLSLHYNNFTKISLIGNITTRDFFTKYSRSMVTLNLGENLRLKGEHLQFFGKFKNFSTSAALLLEALNIDSYTNYKKDGEYSRNSALADINVRIALRRMYSFGLGSRFEAVHYRPDLTSKIEVKGDNNFFNTYASFKINNLSNVIYPRSGLKMEIEASYIYNQHPRLNFFNQGRPITNTDSLGIRFNNFFRTTLNYEHYFSLSKKTNLSTQIQAGINFNQKEMLLNNFYIGGLVKTYRNQITFAGINEGTLTSGSVATAMLALRYQLYPNLFLIGKANALYHDFVLSNKSLQHTSFLTGYAVTVGYNFLLGPLEISAMYCDQTNKLLSYINLGIPF